MSFHVPNEYREKYGMLASEDSIGNNGAFMMALGRKRNAVIIASDREGWEHVSVSYPDRTPTWNEMCLVKDIFWDVDDCIVQYHPPKNEYVNNHKFCLHLWRPTNMDIPRPSKHMVGI